MTRIGRVFFVRPTADAKTIRENPYKLYKNEIFVSHIAVGGDTNRGDPPWPVSSPATFSLYEIL